MAKVALLIGVSEYGSGLNPLPGAVRDVEAVQQVLQPLEMGGFDEVKLLPNPNPPVMREAIEALFSGRTKDDLVLLFFSGHVVQDDSGKLYFSTSITCKSPKADLIGVSAISASFVHELMSNSPCQRQVVILDCCLSHASAPEMTANDDGIVDIKTQLGGEGRAILASFTSTLNSFDSEDYDHSVYTRYLVEGMRTGAADLDGDGWISVDELHEYASNRVQAVAPAVKPTFYRVEDRYKILLLVAPVDDPKLKYRKEAERWVSRGEISRAGRYSLNKLAERLQLTVEDCSVIEAEVLQPYQEYQEKLERYKREFAQAIANNYPLGTQEREKLRDLQQSLALRDEDVAPIEERMAFQLAALSQFEDNADEVAQSKPSSVLQKYLQIPDVQPTNPSPASEDEANELTQSDIESKLNSLPSKPSRVLPEYRPIPAVQPTNPTPAVNASSSLAGSQTRLPSVSTFPNKFLLPIGIGGALATVALAIAISSHIPIAPPADRADGVSSSPNSSPKPSPRKESSNKGSSPGAPASSESKVCTVLVNGNLRSEPAPFRDNIVESLKQPLPVTGKQTPGGWVEVKLPNNKLAWTHVDVISNKEEMGDCIARKRITIKTVEDILPPSKSPSLNPNEF